MVYCTKLFLSMTVELSPSHIARFQRYIYWFFEGHGRTHLPWRRTDDPYRIMVSEIMLQQTQVDRVIPKYEHFLELFSTLDALAAAPQSEVITAWQGLGYNRRGLNLQRAAQTVIQECNGIFPRTYEELLSLPGIGPYTAAAIQAFAFNQPSVVIETNVRTVFIFHFFHEAYNVEDKELITLIEATLDRENPRLWYSALMDYGTYLKQTVPNPSRKAKSYIKQSKLEGSNRQARGLVLKELVKKSGLSLKELLENTQLPPERITTALDQLEKENFVIRQSDDKLYLK
jgi:A/G-specific adenine glycosylase